MAFFVNCCGSAAQFRSSLSEVILNRERFRLADNFSEDGNPTLRTTIAVMKAPGLELSAESVEII